MLFSNSKPFGLDDDDPLSESPLHPRNVVRRSSLGSNDSFDQFLMDSDGGGGGGGAARNHPNNNDDDDLNVDDSEGNNDFLLSHDNNNNNNHQGSSHNMIHNSSNNIMMNSSFNMNFNSSNLKNGMINMDDSADHLLQAVLEKSTNSIQDVAIEDDGHNININVNNTMEGGGGGGIGIGSLGDMGNEGDGGGGSSMMMTMMGDHGMSVGMMIQQSQGMGGGGGGGGGVSTTTTTTTGLSRIPSFHPLDSNSQQQPQQQQQHQWSHQQGSGGGMNSNNDSFANAMFGAKPLNISMNSISSTLRNKKAQQQTKAGRLQATKSSITSSTLRSTMSDGMLARALKARYNTTATTTLNKNIIMGSSNDLTSRLGGNHASSRAALLSKLQHAGAISASRANNLGQLGNANNNNNNAASANVTDASRNRLDMMMMNLGGGGDGGGGAGGGRNATWGGPPTKRSPSSASIFSNMIQSSAKHSLLASANNNNNNSRSNSKFTTTTTLSQAKSTNSLLKHAAATAATRKSSSNNLVGTGIGGIGGTTSTGNTSITDLLRMSKSQTQTQSLLRQSSAQSLLLRQTSNQNFKQVDVNSLLPMSQQRGGGMGGGLSVGANLGGMGMAGGGGGGGFQGNSTFNMNNSNASFMGGSSDVGGGSSGNSMEESSLLHQSCRLYPTMDAIVESALGLDPEAIRRRVPVVSNTESSVLNKPQGMGMMLPNKMQRKTQEIFAYPINIAIKHGASMTVVELLVKAGPDVLAFKDGTDASGSLSIALTTKHCDLALIQLLLSANPECVGIPDRRANYPLHIAASNGCSLDIVKKVHSMFPRALQMRNFHSQTPLDIAQRSTVCPEEVMNFLSTAAYHSLEHSAYHLDHHQNATPTDGGCGSRGGGGGGQLVGLVGSPMGNLGGGGNGGGVIFEGNFDDIMETNM
jgi:hypothetical protein